MAIMNNFGKMFSALVLFWMSILVQGLNSGYYGKEISDISSVENKINQFQLKKNVVRNIGVSHFPASSEGHGSHGMTTGPFTSESRRDNAGFGRGPFASSNNGGTSFNGGGSGPFTVNSGNAKGSPFTASSGNTGNSGGSGGSSPFSSALGKGGPFTSESGRDNSGIGKGPFASSNNGGTSFNGGGSGPFTVNSGNAKGSPFTASSGNTGNKGGSGGSSPFSSALGNGGPGSLAGGDFMPKNTSALMGHDYSKGYGGMDGVGNYQGVDNSRFDTSEYQHMLQGLFKSDQDTVDMGTLFDGSNYNYDTVGSVHVNTGQEASIGSYASTDMSSYEANNGIAKGQVGTQNQEIYTNGIRHSNEHYSDGSYANRIHSDTSASTDMSYSNPFNIDNYDLKNSNRGQSSHDDGMSPFKINNDFKAGGNSGRRTDSGPFSALKSESLGSGGDSPFKVSQGSSDKGQNPFDTNKYQAAGSFSNGNGYNGNLAPMGSGTSNKGIDEFGNVDFSKLSESHASSYTGVSSLTGSGSSYTGSDSSYTDSKSSNSGSGLSYSSHSSQYETPFESDNYNDLLDNPFDSSSQNFQSPYQSGNNFHQSSNRGSQPVGYSNQGHRAPSGGPAGDPFNQGSHSMQGPYQRG